jgi:hypothetical protein
MDAKKFNDCSRGAFELPPDEDRMVVRALEIESDLNFELEALRGFVSLVYES